VIDAIIGRKLGMTSIFNDRGQVSPVTVIEAGPVTVMQIKTPTKDKYAAVQIGFGEKKQQRAGKPELGHAAKAESAPKRELREVRVSEDKLAEFKLGQTITVADVGLEAGGFVDLIGTSIGKGFQGVMKRHNFAGGKASHGVHEYKRHGGSIGCSSNPSRVRKGTKMPGQMGSARVTIQNIEIVEVRPDQNLILVKGPVPGHKDSIVMVRVARKKRANNEEAA